MMDRNFSRNWNRWPNCKYRSSTIVVLESADASKDIYLNSRRKRLCRIRIYDTMQYIKPDCYNLYWNGGFYGSGIVVCRSSRKTFGIATFKSNDSPTIRRSAGVATDMEINLREMLKLKDELYNIISHHSGQTLTKCTKICERNTIGSGARKRTKTPTTFLSR
jgi:ATP-dependent Clp protease protease subunit